MYRFRGKRSLKQGYCSTSIISTGTMSFFCFAEKSRTWQEKDKKRKDRIVLRTGEGQRTNGSYGYRWTDKTGKCRRVYAKTLHDLTYIVCGRQR